MRARRVLLACTFLAGLSVACGAGNGSDSGNGPGAGGNGAPGGGGPDAASPTGDTDAGTSTGNTDAGPSTCTKRTCAQQGIGCGPAGDGCGGALQCGTCTAPQTCGGGGHSGVCGESDAGSMCVPKTCKKLGFDCGPAGDGCGGNLECGTCTSPATCGGGGTPSVCGGGVVDSGGGPPVAVVSASFAGTSNVEVNGMMPDGADLPGGTWQTDYVNLNGSFQGFIDTGAGNPAPALHVYDVGSSSGSVALSLKSAGSYVKPSQLSLQVDVMTLNPSTVLLFGFYASPPVSGADTLTGFTGLALHTDTGNLDLVEGGVTKSTSTFGGSFNGGAFNTLGYTVDTTTGAVSNVMLAGKAFSFSTTAFTDAATSYLAMGTEAGAPSGACSYYDNLMIKN